MVKISRNFFFRKISFLNFFFENLKKANGWIKMIYHHNWADQLISSTNEIWKWLFRLIDLRKKHITWSKKSPRFDFKLILIGSRQNDIPGLFDPLLKFWSICINWDFIFLFMVRKSETSQFEIKKKSIQIKLILLKCQTMNIR